MTLPRPGKGAGLKKRNPKWMVSRKEKEKKKTRPLPLDALVISAHQPRRLSRMLIFPIQIVPPSPADDLAAAIELSRRTAEEEEARRRSMQQEEGHRDDSRQRSSAPSRPPQPSQQQQYRQQPQMSVEMSALGGAALGSLRK